MGFLLPLLSAVSFSFTPHWAFLLVIARRAVRCAATWRTMWLLLLVALAGVAAQPCAEDPAHKVGDSWMCDNRCDTCTCGADGHITAAGCDRGDASDTSEQDFEATVVRLAFAFALVFLLACGAICFCMCVKGGNKQASTLVRELEMEEE